MVSVVDMIGVEMVVLEVVEVATMEVILVEVVVIKGVIQPSIISRQREVYLLILAPTKITNLELMKGMERSSSPSLVTS